jgi:hypothetical protein
LECRLPNPSSCRASPPSVCPITRSTTASMVLFLLSRVISAVRFFLMVPST